MALWLAFTYFAIALVAVALVAYSAIELGWRPAWRDRRKPER